MASSTPGQYRPTYDKGLVNKYGVPLPDDYDTLPGHLKRSYAMTGNKSAKGAIGNRPEIKEIDKILGKPTKKASLSGPGFRDVGSFVNPLVDHASSVILTTPAEGRASGTFSTPSAQGILSGIFKTPAETRGGVTSMTPVEIQDALQASAMFRPKPGGGWDAVGPLTPGQAHLLESLGNVEGGTKPRPRADLTPDEMDLYHETYAQGEGSRHPYRFGDYLNSMSLSPHSSQGDLHDFAKVFGVPRGNPYYAQPFEMGVSPTEADVKTGATVGRPPDWVTTKAERLLWERYQHDPAHIAALAGMKDDVRAALAQIIDTINRRGPQQPGLGSYGGN